MLVLSWSRILDIRPNKRKAMKELLERAKELFGPDTQVTMEYRVWIRKPLTKQRERTYELEWQLLAEFNGYPIDFSYSPEEKP